MVQSVELVLDDATEAAVRAQWEQLLAAGVPSHARFAGARPHVTIGVAEEFPDVVEEQVRAVVADAPSRLGSVRLGGLVTLRSTRRGTSGFALARAVVPTRAILDLQREVHGVLAPCPGLSEHVAPGRFTPHVTLAMHLDPDQLAEAVGLVVAGTSPLTGRVTGVRRWDGSRRRDWLIA